MTRGPERSGAGVDGPDGRLLAMALLTGCAFASLWYVSHPEPAPDRSVLAHPSGTAGGPPYGQHPGKRDSVAADDVEGAGRADTQAGLANPREPIWLTGRPIASQSQAWKVFIQPIPPEGHTAVELASEVGASKAPVARALKKLEADGRVEKVEGRPARYVAVGGEG